MPDGRRFPLLLCVASGLAAGALLLGCSESGDAGAYQPSRTTILAGERLYTESCLVCHQHDGQGVPGFQPPLVGSSLLAGDSRPLIEYMLLGSQVAPRPASLNGEDYMGVMPPYANLT
ncbi:MAG: cytochrome c, partial [Planctomycetota bacterium]